MLKSNSSNHVHHHPLHARTHARTLTQHAFTVPLVWRVCVCVHPCDCLTGHQSRSHYRYDTHVMLESREGGWVGGWVGRGGGQQQWWRGVAGRVRVGGLFWCIHKSGISQLPVLRIYPGDSHKAGNVISRANVPPRPQRTHLSGYDTLQALPPTPPPTPWRRQNTPLIAPKFLIHPVRPHWSTAKVRLHSHVCLDKIRQQTAEAPRYLFISFKACHKQAGR